MKVSSLSPRVQLSLLCFTQGLDTRHSRKSLVPGWLDVVEEYLGGKYSEMFHKMALAFGIDARETRDVERALLWNKAF